jgi:two-component system, OmpR family, response regulator
MNERGPVLLIEGDASVAAAVHAALASDGWPVDWVATYARGQSLLDAHGYRAIVIDLGPTTGAGWDLLRELRARRDATAVIAIGAEHAADARIAALDAGADDVLTRPIDATELPARLRAVRRRQIGSLVNEFRIGDLHVDVDRKSVWRGGVAVPVSAQEFKTLVALLQRADRVVTRRELEEALYGWNAGIASNAVEVFVHQLRRKLGADRIRTVRGFGYRILSLPP